jgi:hypothetical protein
VPFKIRRNVYLGGGGALVLLVLILSLSHSSAPTGGSNAPLAHTILVDLKTNGVPVKASSIDDLAALPALGAGNLLAAGKFEPSGSSFPDGLRITWPLSSKRSGGEKLWIVTLDETNHRWLGTGEMAEVAQSGTQASGRVYHFSNIGLSDQKPFGEEGGGEGGNGGPRKWGALAQLAAYIEVQHGGSAESAMVEYNKWLEAGGKTLVGSLKQKIQENRAAQEQYRQALEQWESIPEMSRPDKNFSEPKTVFESLGAGEQESVRKLMQSMYGAAGSGKEAFHTVALVMDKGLEVQSDDFKARKYSADPVNNELSLVMAEARDHWIDDVICEVAQKNNWKVRRSDSGNQTSGMKSDLDQTFYVFEPDGKGGWKRAYDSDKKFIEQFKTEWEARNKARNDGRLGLESLDIASIEGKNRFPDPRNLVLTSYSQEFRRTVIALRNTPGAYTTYGAVLQQMQLRALEAIRQKNPRAFRGYGPPEGTTTGKVGKLEGYTQEDALDVMFGKEMTPELMKGLAFGAAVANFVELGHYMDEPKFEVKYHLRTFEDAVETKRLLEEGKNAGDKREYERIRDEDAPRVQQYLVELFPGTTPADENARTLEKLAMETSLKLRLMHKGKAVGGVSANATDEQKKMAVFSELAKGIYKDKFDPKSMEQVTHAENEHRKLARELCLAAIYHTSDEAFSLAFNPANGKIDLSHVRNLLNVKSDADWAKVEQNITEGMHVTLLYAMYDLGFAESRRLRDYLTARHKDQAWEIDKLWFRSQLQGIESVVREPGIYLETASDKFDELSKRVQEHVADELGLEFAESQATAGKILLTEGVTWNWRKVGHEKMNDPQTLLSLTNVLKSAIHSHGDMSPVMATVADEMFLNWVPVLGQLEQIRRADMKDLAIMGASMAFPVAGQVYFFYQLGDSMYSIYDEGFATPREENAVDAAYRGFVGPETRAFGEPGKPPPTWGAGDESALEDAKSNLALAEKRASITMQAELDPAPWPRSDWDEAEELFQRSQEMTAREGANSGALDALRKQVDDLETRRRQFLESTDGPWTGDLLGFAAQPTQKFIDSYLLKEVTPTVGFFTKGVVDLRIKFTPDDQAQLTASRATVVSATNMVEKMKASAMVQELEMKRERAHKAVDYAANINQWPELKYRFQRDSLYLYLREKYRNTTDQQFNTWFDQWMKASSMATANAMVAKGLLSPSATQPSIALPAETALGGPDPTQDRTPHPLPETRLRERTKADLERARGLTNAYEDMERRRAAATQRNLDRAKNYFRAANVSLAVEKMKGNPQIQDYVLALRYLAIPRSVPQLKTTIYRIATGPANVDPMVEKNAEFIFKYKSSITVDPTLYFPDGGPGANGGTNTGAGTPPGGSGSAELAGQYYMKHSYLLPAAAKSAASSGVGDGIPLLPGSSELITQLLTEHSREVENGQGLIVISSALANDMADMTGAPPTAFMHLPSAKHSKVTWNPGKDGPLGATNVDGKQRYLMAQSVGYVSTPEEMKGEEIWYLAERFPMSGCAEYVPTPKFSPIFKVIRQESGAFSGSCDFSIKLLGILRQTQADISGVADDKARKAQVQIHGHYLRTWTQKGVEGDNEDFSANLLGVADGLHLGANIVFVNNSTVKDAGTIRTVFTYLNNTPPSYWSKEMADRELANTPNIRERPANSWFLEPIARAAAGSKEPRPLKGTWHSANGQFELDQCGTYVAGTVHLTGDIIGPVMGTGDATGFNFEFYDGGNRSAQGELSATKDGSYTGFVISSSLERTPMTLSR